MKWRGRRQSGNVEDRRGISGGKIAAGGGVIAIIVVLVNMFMGGDNSAVINEINNQLQQNTSTEQTVPLSAQDEEMGNLRHKVY